MSDRTGNALLEQTSPYLLQHAHNPVDWYPWSGEALEQAEKQNKPILLSIGYSACHWCHVMAHESFEDTETAQLMNSLFVNIKVDREERPDLDKIYQTSHQLLTRRPGGWPLTMFLTPEDRTPFFGGTYFPPTPRHGLPSFREVLTGVANYFRSHRSEIGQQNASLINALITMESESATTISINDQPLVDAQKELAHAFDEVHGGFGFAPKFPHPTNLERLLRTFAASSIRGKPNVDALHMAEFTLRKMAMGGIYDHLGGGFARYSVDELWMIPHFEKMLYDNGPLLALSCELWQLTHDELFRTAAQETAQWVLREMQAPDGGYYSTLDADSEGEEGKYYVWTSDEVASLLSPPEWQVVQARFGFLRPPNFEGKAWHLHVFVDGEDLHAATGFDAETTKKLLTSARAKLFAARSARVRPGLDDKILTAWNGLMIRGMAVAGTVLGDAQFVDSATRALDFLRDRMWVDGRLLATSRQDRSHLAAYLDDYAFVMDGALTLLQIRWRQSDLAFVVDLARVLLEHFEDRDRGGFFFTADDHEALIHRPKPMMDDAVPSGNGVAAHALSRLGHLLGESTFLEAAERAIRAGWASVTRVPHAHNAMLRAVEEYIDPPQLIVLRGEGEQLERWRSRCLRHYAPRRMTLAIPSNAGRLPGLLAERKPLGDIVAYLCDGHQCGPPVTEFGALEEVLARTEVEARIPLS